MRAVCLVVCLLASLCLCPGLHATTIPTVWVDDPGNAGEMSGAGVGGYGPDRVCGAVGYAYRIGTYEVTARQYTDFLNNKAKCDSDPYGLYSTEMVSTYGCQIQRSGGGTVADPYIYTVADDWADRPVNYVSYWDACRFANWLSNGQGSGNTENGTYTLNGYTGGNGADIQRNPGWTWAVTSEDEWYKAAYYKGDGTYWDYPMQSDVPTTPSNDITNPDGGNNANFNQYGYTIGSPYWRTEVGEFENSESHYATFDQGGNVWEWNESIVYQGELYASRGFRGGCMFGNPTDLHAAYRYGNSPYDENSSTGFRVVAVPEPSGVLALLTGLGSLGLAFRRRR